MLGGGERITVTGSTNNWERIILRESYPSAATTWTAIVRQNKELESDTDRASVQAFVMCGS